jgi:mRNA interferase HigB
MHVISESTLDQFVERHPAAEAAIATWLTLVKPQHFRKQQEVQALLPATDFLPSGVVIFNLGGNNYRISANIKYVTAAHRVGRIYIRRVMTHAEYTKRTRDDTL